MPSAWLPNSVAESILSEKAGQDEAKRVFGYIRNRLRAIDARLDLILCDREDPDNELLYGYYYVIRRNENGTMTFWQVQQPDGSYREPDERIVQAFQQMDRHTVADLRREQEEKQRRKRKREAEWQERKGWELKDEADFAFRVQVPVKDGVPQRAAKKAG